MLILAAELAQRGLQVNMLFVRANGQYKDLIHPGLRLIDFGAKRALTSLLRLVRFLKKKRPSILLSTLDHTNLIAIWAHILVDSRTKVIVRIDNIVTPGRKRSGGLTRFLVGFLTGLFYPFADAVIAVSRAVAADLVRSCFIPPKRISIINNPISLSTIVQSSKESVTHPWLLPSSAPVVLGVGRLAKQKDFGTLIRAFRIVRDQMNAKLIILGEGAERSHLEYLVRCYDLGADVELPGFVSNPYKYMSHSSVFVLSSRWEGFGIVLVEALALGIQVVATDCPGGPSEVLDNGQYGRLVAIGDSKAMAEAIINSIKYPMDPMELQNRAADFDIRHIADEYLEVMGLR